MQNNNCCCAAAEASFKKAVGKTAAAADGSFPVCQFYTTVTLSGTMIWL